jgi:hypothetical protein
MQTCKKPTVFNNIIILLSNLGQAEKLPVCVREMPGLYLSLETGYLTEVTKFPSGFPGKCSDCTLKSATTSFFDVLQNQLFTII